MPNPSADLIAYAHRLLVGTGHTGADAEQLATDEHPATPAGAAIRDGYRTAEPHPRNDEDGS